MVAYFTGRHGSALACTQVSVRSAATASTRWARCGSPGRSYGICGLPRGNSSLVKRPLRRSLADTTHSNVVNQCESMTTMVSGRSGSM